MSRNSVENLTVATADIEPHFQTPGMASSRGRQSRRNLRTVLRGWGPTLTLGPLLGYLVVVPISLLVLSSLKPTGLLRDDGFTLVHYRRFLGEESTWPIVWTTVRFSLGSMVLALSIGIVLAWLIERSDIKARKLLRGLIILPMATPPVLLAIGWVMLLDPRVGALNSFFELTTGARPFTGFSLGTMVFVQALTLVPSTFLILSPAFRNMDPALEDAAATSGAPLLFTIRRILLPLLFPATLSAGIYLTIVGFVVFDVPGILGVHARERVLAAEIVRASQAHGTTGLPNYGRISAIAVSLLVLLVLLAGLYHWGTRRGERYTTITGKGFRSKQVSLGKWRGVASSFVWAYFALAVLLPFAMLLWTSLLPFYSGVRMDRIALLSFANYESLVSNSRAVVAAGNSLRVALFAATAVAALSTAIAWTLVRTKAPLRKVMEVLSFAPLAMAGVMMGVALIYTYLYLSFIPIYGTIWIIAIGHATLFTAFGVKAMNGVVLQLHPSLEEAGYTSGANRAQLLRRITLPLLYPAILGVWIWTFAHSAREFTTALVLQGRRNSVLPTLLWDYWDGGQQTTTAAVGLVLMLVLLGVVLVWLTTERSRSRTL